MEKEKMNILLLTEFFPSSKDKEITGGIEARAYYLAKSLSVEHNVYVITSKRPKQKNTETFDNIKIFRVGPSYDYSNYGKIIQRVMFSFSLFIQINKYTKKLSIDAVDAMNFFTYPAIFRRLRAKKFLTYHEVWVGEWVKNTGTIIGVVGEIFERLILYLIKRTKVKIISVSDFTKEKLLKYSKNICVVPNGIDLSKYKTQVKKTKQPTMCVISRLIPQKRIDDILYALVIIKKKLPDIKVKIIGQGEEKAGLKKLARELKLTDNVEFLGYVKSHEEVVKILKSSHCFVHASIREGFGIVLIESIACGVPYVCSNIDPFVEVTKGGIGGFIFEQKNYYALADKVLNLMTNKKVYDRKVEECADLVALYDWDEIAKSLVRVYSGLV